MNKKFPFAVFILGKIGSKFCATTREDGRIGLPGGKLDLGETPENAALRESEEEGWLFPKDTLLNLIHKQNIDNKLVFWYKANKSPKKLNEYKEKYRKILPILITKNQLKNSGFGNENLPIYD